MLISEIDVPVLGGAGVDTIVSAPRLPLPFADSYPAPAIVTRAALTNGVRRWAAELDRRPPSS